MPKNIMTLETALAKVSLGAVDLREPEKTYHLQSIATFASSLPGFDLIAYEDAIHSPHVTEINNSTPDFWPEMMHQMQTSDLATIKAYLRYHLLTAAAPNLPKAFDDENFNLYGRILYGEDQPKARWKRCSSYTDSALGEALGKVYVEHYFAGDSKQETLEMVHDIEEAMGHDLDQIDWMSPATKARAREKLNAIANKIGYPNKWRDYTKLIIKPTEALGNDLRANAFENDRELRQNRQAGRQGRVADVTAHRQRLLRRQHERHQLPGRYSAAAFLRPHPRHRRQLRPHRLAIIGHELTHGFDDEGRKFDAKGTLDDWWTPEDLKNFTARTDCLVHKRRIQFLHCG